MDYLQYQYKFNSDTVEFDEVLNLVINGLPSIQDKALCFKLNSRRFKPCYKWITFNTVK